MTENDFEENTAQVLRYKPKPIDELVKLTRFSRKEIQNLYRGFKQVLSFFCILSVFIN